MIQSISIDFVFRELVGDAVEIFSRLSMCETVCFDLSKTALPNYCPRSGFQSAKPKASESRKLVIAISITASIGYSISLERATSASLIRSGSRFRMTLASIGENLLLSFSLHSVAFRVEFGRRKVCVALKISTSSSNSSVGLSQQEISKILGMLGSLKSC